MAESPRKSPRGRAGFCVWHPPNLPAAARAREAVTLDRQIGLGGKG